MHTCPLSERDAKTARGFDAPRVGDRFTEMYSFWVYVVGVTDNHVDTLEASPPCTFPKDGIYKHQTLTEFRRRFAYGGKTAGYWVTYVDRKHCIKGWAKAAKARG